jgi:hypothetical protein
MHEHMDFPRAKEEEEQIAMGVVQEEAMKEAVHSNAASEDDADLDDEKMMIDNNHVELLCWKAIITR